MTFTVCARLTPHFPRREWAEQVAVRDGRPFWNTPFLAVGLAFRTIETLYFLATNANGASGQRLPVRWSPEDAGRLVVLPRTLRFATSETATRFKERWKRRSVTESTQPLE